MSCLLSRNMHKLSIILLVDILIIAGEVLDVTTKGNKNWSYMNPQSVAVKLIASVCLTVFLLSALTYVACVTRIEARPVACPMPGCAGHTETCAESLVHASALWISFFFVFPALLMISRPLSWNPQILRSLPKFHPLFVKVLDHPPQQRLLLEAC